MELGKFIIKVQSEATELQVKLPSCLQAKCVNSYQVLIMCKDHVSVIAFNEHHYHSLDKKVPEIMSHYHMFSNSNSLLFSPILLRSHGDRTGPCSVMCSVWCLLVWFSAVERKEMESLTVRSLSGHKRATCDSFYLSYWACYLWRFFYFYFFW